MTQQDQDEGGIRPCGMADSADILAIINVAAEAYRDVIPTDRWHEPYMAREELAAGLTDGVKFCGYVVRDRLIGVMGMQRRHDVDLIRHAYVLPEWQAHGIGSRLLRHLCRDAERPILIGTWAAAEWAIRFYERHGFARVSEDSIGPLLRTYWNVPERQVATSVVLACPPIVNDAVDRLIGGAKTGARRLRGLNPALRPKAGRIPAPAQGAGS
jgi:GNAT superfamily N-acetyltransferase